MPEAVTRRGFLVGIAAGAVVIGSGARTVWGEDGGTFAPTVWFEIDADGIVTVNAPKVELGQHIGTALAQVIADELETPWETVRLRYVAPDPRLISLGVGGSSSVTNRFEILSHAGAAGRIELVKAGASLLGVEPATCKAETGRVVAADGTSVSYGEIVRRAHVTATYDKAALAALPLKPRAEHRIIGRSVPALDIPGKVTGEARYGIDAALPGMVYGKLLLPPVRRGARLTAIDDSAALRLPGYVRTVGLDADPSADTGGWAAVLAETYPGALAAASVVKASWDNGPHAAFDDAALAAEAMRLAGDRASGVLILDEGGVDQAFAETGRRLRAQYTSSIAVHAPLEPMNALVGPVGDAWEIHSGTQSPEDAVALVAKLAGVPADKVRIGNCFLGGGFGRRSDLDPIRAAALAAKAAGRPVKLIYTREDDFRTDTCRSPTWQFLEAALDDNGRLRGLTHDIVAGWPGARGGTDDLAKGIDGRSPFDDSASDGADFWYTVPAHRIRTIEHGLVQAALPPGWLRSVSEAYTCFAVESFIDELALLQHADPVAFRLAMLDGAGRQAGDNPRNRDGAKRIAAVLQKAVETAGWGRDLPRGRALGVACGYGLGRSRPSWIACVAEVAVDASAGSIDVRRLTVAADVGTAINPRNLEAQFEGAALWGLSLALHEQAGFRGGAVEQANFDSYTPLRQSQVPEVEIVLVSGGGPPLGAGEPGVTVVAPAIANAVAAATGLRLRDLPMTPERVKAARG